MTMNKKMDACQLIGILKRKGYDMPDIITNGMKYDEPVPWKCMQLLTLIEPSQLYNIVFDNPSSDAGDASGEERSAARRARYINRYGRKGYVLWILHGRYTHNIYLPIP